MSQNNTGVLVQKYNNAIACAQNALVGRDEEVRMAFVAVLANENCYMIGDPGTAKSALVANVARTFSDQRLFQRLLGKFVLPEEVFGPLDVQKMKQGYYNRKIGGYMPASTLAFLDEGFKASESLLNSLLTVMNEREFDLGASAPRSARRSSPATKSRRGPTWTPCGTGAWCACGSRRSRRTTTTRSR